MDYNPYAARYAELKLNMSSIEDKLNNYCKQIKWYDHFDISTASSSLNVCKRQMKLLDKDINGVEATLADMYSHVMSLEKAIPPLYDPRNWFSSERASQKLELDMQKQKLAQLQSQLDKLGHLRQINIFQVREQQAELDSFRSFDRLEAEAIVAALNIQIGQLIHEVALLQPKMEHADNQLRAPLAEMSKFEHLKNALEADINQAENFERSLTLADNSFERRKIHDACNVKFGESKPSKVIRTKQSELNSLNRNIRKLQDRLLAMSDRFSRVVDTLVIDGNNLCYQHQNFIGLDALQVAAKKLSEDYEVLIVFDAGIRGLLRMNDRDIAAYFGKDIKVHVVATMQKADETLLDSAAGKNAYVISNDRFGDFPDKPAVSESRIIRHEILNGKVFIHDLNLTEDITTR